VADKLYVVTIYTPTLKDTKANLDDLGKVKLTGLATEVGNAQTKIEALTKAVTDGFTSMEKTITEKIKAAATSVQTNVLQMQTDFQTKLTSISQNVTTSFTTLASTISDKLKSISTDATTKWTEISNTFSTKMASISTDVSTKFATIASTITDKLKTASSDVSTKCKEIADTISTKMGDASTTISTEAGKWKDSVSTGITGVQNLFGSGFDWGIPALPELNPTWATSIQSAVEDVKKQFPKDFSWEIPELKIPVKTPKFAVEGKWEYDDDGNVKGVPKIKVEWYRRAAELGALFTEPAIVGVGDASQPEMLIGETTLFDNISRAVAMANGGGFNQTNNITVQDANSASETARLIRNQTRQMLQRIRGGV